MRPSVRTILVAILLLLLPIAATSAPARAAVNPGEAAYAQGQAAYKAHQTGKAITDFEQAINLGYRTPGVYYQLGLSFSRLKRWNDAVWAYTTVSNLDPQFASIHPTLTTKLAAARASGGVDHGPPDGLPASPQAPVAVGGNNSSPGNAGSPGTGSSGGPGAPQAAAIAAALQGGTIYVDPALAAKIPAGDVATLNRTASDLQGSSSTAVKFAFISTLPAGYSSLGNYTHELFTRLGLSRAAVIVASPTGVAAWSDRLSQDQVQPLTDASRGDFLQGSYALGADRLARAIVKKADDNDSQSGRGKAIALGAIVLIVAAALALYFGLRASRWRRSYAQAVQWRNSLTEVLNSTEEHVNYLPDTHAAKQTFLKASAYYSTASTIIDQLGAKPGSRDMKALGEARTNLQAAERTLKEADLQAAGQSTAGASAVAGGEIAPAPVFRDRASGQAAPAACFFCAKPLDPATAQTVEVPIGNTTRRVMACDEHAAEVRAGRQPQIRAVPNPAMGGQYQPWWGVPSYIPARDYVYDPYYYRGGGLGWGDLFLYNALFNQQRQTIIFDNDGYGGPGGGYGGDRRRVRRAWHLRLRQRSPRQHPVRRGRQRSAQRRADRLRGRRRHGWRPLLSLLASPGGVH